MNCPVEAVDYESALVQADWYEENGYQEIADQVRGKIQPSFDLLLAPQQGRTRKSGCHSRIAGPHGWMFSRCGTQPSNYYMASRCRSRTRSWRPMEISYCKSRTRIG